MSDLTEPFPDDVEALHALLRGALSKLDVAIAERDAAVLERDRALEQNELFRHLLHQLRRAHPRLCVRPALAGGLYKVELAIA